MKQHTGKVLSLIMLIISLLITLFLLECSVAGIFIIRAVPPVVVMFLFTAYWGWIDTVYLRCYRCLRGKAHVSNGLSVQCIVLSALTGSTALSMWIVFLGSILVLQGFAPVMLNFLGVAVVGTAYAINTLLILWALHKHTDPPSHNEENI